MWSCGSVLDGRKDGSGFTLSALRVRRKEEALRRHVWQMKAEVSVGSVDGRRRVEKREGAMVWCVVVLEQKFEMRLPLE